MLESCVTSMAAQFTIFCLAVISCLTHSCSRYVQFCLTLFELNCTSNLPLKYVCFQYFLAWELPMNYVYNNKHTGMITST